MQQENYPTKDAETVFRIFNRVIEIFDFPDKPSDEEIKENYLTDGGLFDVKDFPVINIETNENGGKFINFNYFSENIPIISASYNPTITIWGFIGEARKLLKSEFSEVDEIELEEWIEKAALDMTCNLISHAQQRMFLAMRNFNDEVIHNWLIVFLKWKKKANSERGFKSPSISEKTFLRKLLKAYEDEIVELWSNSSDKSLEEKKIQLAREYPALFNHWKRIRKDYTSQNPDWREYAKAGKFSDTPNDLIDALEDCRDMASLALEHAGRRAGLMNPDIKNDDLEKRQQKILVTAYSSKRLRDFKAEGDKLLEEAEK